MFERELTDSLFVQRWGIVRTVMPQSIAEHSYLVAHYANDIAIHLGLSQDLHLSVLQYALWHDLKDEVFTGDLPGPNKRDLLNAIGADAKDKWDAKLGEWGKRTFTSLYWRSGGHTSHVNRDAEIVKLVVKTADWLEAAVRMATEEQMGNRCAERHIVPNMNGARETARKLCETVFRINTEGRWRLLDAAIVEAVRAAQHEQSRGPWITGEDDDREYHDPCVDNTKGPKG